MNQRFDRGLVEYAGVLLYILAGCIILVAGYVGVRLFFATNIHGGRSVPTWFPVVIILGGLMAAILVAAAGAAYLTICTIYDDQKKLISSQAQPDEIRPPVPNV
jgi:hypothetical protein